MTTDAIPIIESIMREVSPLDSEPSASWMMPNSIDISKHIEVGLREADFADIVIDIEETTMYYADEDEW